MEAIILAGGLGTRLRSAVPDLPKCMADVAGKPFLYYLFEYLKKNEFCHVILSLGYKHEIIEDWIHSETWPFSISFSVEEEPLGTGGALKLSLRHACEDNVFIFNGDTFFDIDTNKFYNAHISRNAEISIALKPMENFERYGNVIIDADSRITCFQEKQPCTSGRINGGIYIIRKNARLFNTDAERFSFETEILQKAAGKSDIYGFISSGYFIDIGIPEDYIKAGIDFKDLFQKLC